jgi:hypothetical protein
VARKPNRPSTIDRLLPDLQALIGNLRGQGRTIDEIRAKLLELDVEVSRSALGRHVRSLAEAQVTMQRSRQLAEALVKEFGSEPDDKMARLNIELAHGLLMRLMLATHIDEETGEAGPIILSPEDAMFVARAVQSLASASKTTEDKVEKRIAKARLEATQEAAEKAVNAAKSRGLSKETVDAIAFAVLGSEA